MMAQREMRMHHYLWHTVRDTWLFLDKATRDKIRGLGWEPPRPALKPSGQSRSPIYDNDSGEDFFFMHRQMIASVNAVAATLNDPRFPKVEGWPQLPLPNDVDYPVTADSPRNGGPSKAPNGALPTLLPSTLCR